MRSTRFAFTTCPIGRSGQVYTCPIGMACRQISSVVLGCILVACWQTVAQQTKEPAPSGDTFVLKSDVSVVVVPVVVRDAQDREVGTLKKEDFQVLDNGKPQVISGFTIQKHEHETVEAATKAPDPMANHPGVAPTPTTAPERFLVFMFDDMHLSFGDLAQARKTMVNAMAENLTALDMAAILSTSGRINSGLTYDHAKLQDTIARLQPQNLYRSSGTQCPNIDYYQADLMENQHNHMALDAAIDETMQCAPGLPPSDAAKLAESTAMEVLATGDQDARVALSTVKECVKRMAPLPGQHVLILVSPGFLTVSTEALSAESQIMDLAAQSNVIISALDARGLYTTNVEAGDTIDGSAHTVQLKSDYHRSSAELNENVMASLAYATGGTYFHNSNDLQTGFKRLISAPEYLYLLYVSPKDAKPDGTFHRLQIKVDQEGLKVQARRGYFATKPAKHKK
jgi:VWFA-related protein